MYQNSTTIVGRCVDATSEFGQCQLTYSHTLHGRRHPNGCWESADMPTLIGGERVVERRAAM